MTLWLVRSGKYGEQEALALEKNLAVVGWEDVSDLSTLETRADLYRALETTYADEKGKTFSNWESQLWPFAHSMAEGDLVVMPLKNRAAISIGRVTGPYIYRTDLGGATHTRPVKWSREVPRSTFAQDLLYSFGSFMTVCRVYRNDAEARVLSVFNGKPDPALSGKLFGANGNTNSAKVQKEAVATADDAAGSIDLNQVAEDAILMKIGIAFKPVFPG